MAIQNYARRSKIILSQRMKKLIQILLICTIIISCKTNQNPIPPKELKNHKMGNSDSIVFWRADTLSNLLYSNMMPISIVLKKYSIRNDKLFDIEHNTYLNKVHLQYRRSQNQAEDVFILNGLPQNAYYDSRGKQMDWRAFNYSNSGKLDGNFNVSNYSTQFRNGTGFWKDFYFKEFDSYISISFKIKEKGVVKNNFKYGKWEYYNKEGKIDSTKTYTLKDSVDVRFPHCIFNKNEPCY